MSQTCSVEIFETVREADVNHGEWLPMLKEIGISKQAAHELMSIGRNNAIVNVRNCGLLPTAARALYELSRMAPSDIEDGIEAGECRKARQDQERIPALTG